GRSYDFFQGESHFEISLSASLRQDSTMLPAGLSAAMQFHVFSDDTFGGSQGGFATWVYEVTFRVDVATHFQLDSKASADNSLYFGSGFNMSLKRSDGADVVQPWSNQDEISVHESGTLAPGIYTALFDDNASKQNGGADGTGTFSLAFS